MTGRLTLSTTGIKSPLEISSETDRPPETPPTRRPTSRKRPIKPAAAPEASAAPAGAVPADATPATQTDLEAPFYGAGRPRQTSIAINQPLDQRLDELAHATGISRNALAVAAIHQGLPRHVELAHELIVTERLARIGSRQARWERNLRLPDQLLTRLDELLSAARAKTARATRADLVNAALDSALPTDAEPAAELVAAHARNREQHDTL